MKRILKYLAFAITMIGAINWGLVGFFEFNIISYIFGEESLLCRLIYAIIGICGLFCATYAVVECRCDLPSGYYDRGDK